ncbi:MAG: EAL domain-containing protein [Wenzhouxiangella sp.]
MTPAQFTTQLAEAYRRFSKRELEQSSACFCLMLDNWSRIRDQYGYGGLFSVLGSVREHLLRILSGESYACVLNERTLIVTVPDCSLTKAEGMADRLFSQLDQETFELGREMASLSFSLGYCEFDHRFTSVEALLIQLVDGTEHVLQSGGHAVRRISPDVSFAEGNNSDKQMLGLLMEALRKDKLRVFFQPLMSTAGDQSQTYQLLPRLSDSNEMLIPAASFVPVARKANVLGVLDRWMLQRAVQLLCGKYQLQPIRLFLSQGDSLLVHAERREWLSRLLEKHPQVSGRLVLDFALEDALANLKSTTTLIALAHQAGLKICFSRVDEHSKWDLLIGRLRVDYLKMSPQFVHRLASDPALETEFQKLSGPVRQLGTKIIMPMVEDAGVAANLWRTGADYMQGYMIQKESENPELMD